MLRVDYDPDQLVKPIRVTAILYTVVGGLWAVLVGGTALLTLVLGVDLGIMLIAYVPLLVLWIVLAGWQWRLVHQAQRATVALELDQQGMTVHRIGSKPRSLPWASTSFAWGTRLGRPILKHSGGSVFGGVVAVWPLRIDPRQLHVAIAEHRGTPPDGVPPGGLPAVPPMSGPPMFGPSVGPPPAHRPDDLR